MLYVVGFCFQAEDGIRDLVRSRGLGDVYKRQHLGGADGITIHLREDRRHIQDADVEKLRDLAQIKLCLLYTSDAADERSSVDLGGRRILKKKNNEKKRKKKRIYQTHR